MNLKNTYVITIKKYWFICEKYDFEMWSLTCLSMYKGKLNL